MSFQLLPFIIFNVHRKFPLLAGDLSLVVLMGRLREVETDKEDDLHTKTMRAVRAIKHAFGIIEDRNQEVLILIQRIQDVLIPLVSEYSRIITSLTPLPTTNRRWIPRLLDAIRFSQSFLLPTTESIARTLPTATKALLAADIALRSAVKEYELIEAGRGDVWSVKHAWESFGWMNVSRE